MKKISTLFKKDPNDLGRVINEVAPENSWVYDGNCFPTRKYDGTACAVINGELYRRYDAKHGKTPPKGAIACQEADSITGHWPHWIKCDKENKADNYHFEAFSEFDNWEDGTYELCGPKIGNNAEKFQRHYLIPHKYARLDTTVDIISDYSFESIKDYLTKHDIEGIVFHNIDGRMCKIRKSDFGIKR